MVAVLGFVLTWYFTKYQVSDGYVRVNQGLLFRQQRQARLDRVQAIDIVQPLLARIFGLAELKFEVADAGESAVRLAYLKVDDARQLRATILARASGAAVGASPGAGPVSGAEQPGGPAPEAPEFAVLSVPPSRLLGSLLLSEQSFFVVAGGVASVVLSAVTDNRAFYFYLMPAVLGLAASYWNFFNRGYNFTAAVSPDGIRLRYGLLDTQAQTLAARPDPGGEGCAVAAVAPVRLVPDAGERGRLRAVRQRRRGQHHGPSSCRWASCPTS